ncbi:MAG: FtsW/RodA/SpoVE family cell cycle protein, partial [Candidatus Omnitrophica bacterium]|nr:FtsW/RodA/SpoVE family cell cycle protein [Candidatus Omnitrophota bacterium]
MNKEAKIILIIASILIMIGVVMIYSSSAMYAYEKFGDSLFFVKKHLVYLFIGILAAIWCMATPPKSIAANAKIIMM